MERVALVFYLIPRPLLLKEKGRKNMIINMLHPSSSGEREGKPCNKNVTLIISRRMDGRTI
jgi:hypothetical protein